MKWFATLVNTCAVIHRFGPFQLDSEKRRLTRGREPVPLTPKAFDTLLVLLDHAGEVVEKDDLFKAVWPDTFVEEATLAQNIATIRKALGDASDTPTYIATVPRRGYRFLGPVTNATGSEQPTSPPPQTRRPPWIWGAPTLGLVLILTATIAWLAVRMPGPIALPVAFSIQPAAHTEFSTSGAFMSVSPDGRRIAFIASTAAGEPSVWIRDLASPDAHQLPGTDGASQPFWSNDSYSVAFFAGGKLRKANITTLAVETICDAPAESQPLSGTWSRANDILFSSIRDGILKVRAEGGTATAALSRASTDDHVEWPQFLPDGRHFLYVVTSAKPDRSGIYVGSLDSTLRVRVLPTRSYAQYADSGHLFFVRGGTLFAQPFDARDFRVTGEAMPLAEQVVFNSGNARGSFSVSSNGVVAYRTVASTQLTWFDRAGTPLGTAGPAGDYLGFSIAPDNARVAASRIDPQTGTSDIWIFDQDREQRLTFEASWEMDPLWSADGRAIAFNSDRTGRWEVFVKSSTGDEAERRVTASPTSVYAQHWSSDGRLLIRQRGEHDGSDFWMLTPASDATPVRLADLKTDGQSGRVSPDGRWLAYEAWHGRWSAYVRPLQSTDTRWQLSPEGSVMPQWRADGRELFFLAPDLSLMAMDIQPGSVFRPGSPHRLFHTHAVAPSNVTGAPYAVTSDGQRFLIKMPTSPAPITVVVNWQMRFRETR